MKRSKLQRHGAKELRSANPPFSFVSLCLRGSKKIILPIVVLFFSICSSAQRTQINFNKDWKFFLGDDSTASSPTYNDSKWRTLNVPHDWSIEGEFSKDHPTTFNQGALPAGIGWYRKMVTLPASSKDKMVFINFDGIYRNSEVWINGQYLGRRPNGYTSFQYDLTPHLKFGKEENVIAIKVDNSAQPNSRWYTGSGIYRKVWLETTNKVAFENRGVFVSTPQVRAKNAMVFVSCRVKNVAQKLQVPQVSFQIFDNKNHLVGDTTLPDDGIETGETKTFEETLFVKNPQLWSVETPTLYRLVVKLLSNKKVVDQYETTFGIRSFYFDAEKGFFLNNKPLKILGVCNHHDLGALGAAFNTRAAERQLEILKAMGCNAIRTAHNPPATELLDLCDKMGFLVMDEAFDIWKKRKNKFDYNIDFDEWHQRDLEDMVKRDRNHPSVILWSIGNEIREQFDTTGTTIAKELVATIKRLDPTRPVTSALTENIPEKNFIYQSKALDVLGFNYKLNDYAELPRRFPGQKFIASETASALATRGHYDQPSDSNRIWPPDAKSKHYGNADLTVSAYDNSFAYWGASHEASWNAVKKYPFMAGTFVWSGFDFIGEPVPYSWPARSSYYGIIDLAGFPKDVYYMYQSEWTTRPVLHIFPHWNWAVGKDIDVWAYYNNADEVELYLNGKSLGIKRKDSNSLHVMWRVRFEPGTLKAISRKAGKIVLIKEITTAGKAAKIELTADRKTIKANGEDLCFITVKIVDAHGNIIPAADNLVTFGVEGKGKIVGVDNGLQTSAESFKANFRKAYNGLCLVIVQSKSEAGNFVLKASAVGLKPQSVTIRSN